MFCMLLRKHLTGGRIADFRQPPAERSIDISLECTDEMGIPCRKHLILELMGRNSNLILTGPDNRIIDCLRRVDMEMCQARQVLPGLFYHDPPTQGKHNPQALSLQDIQALLQEVDSPKRLDKWLLDTFAGLSPLISRELAYGFCQETDRDILTLDRAALASYLVQQFRFEEFRPTLLLKEDRPSDFSFRPVFQYGTYMTCRYYDSFSALLDAFYTETDHNDRMRQKSQVLRKTVTTLQERTLRKLAIQRREYEGTLDRERLRRMGDIVTANLYQIQRGQTMLRAEDFYDPDMKEIEIPLKPDLSPQQNAAKFYKDYARAKHAEKVLSQQIAAGEMEENYLAAVLEELSRAENERDLSEIRNELEAGGYVRKASRKKQVRFPPSKPMVFRSSDGYRIFAGRNNQQNDLLSLKTARKDDIWLHIQKFHGTHVVIDCGGTRPPDRTITEAAQLAAFYSQGREGQNIPVDVTPVRNLRKPRGARPGMVIYDHYRTVIVTPDSGLPERLKEK